MAVYYKGVAFTHTASIILLSKSEAQTITAGGIFSFLRG